MKWRSLSVFVLISMICLRWSHENDLCREFGASLRSEVVVMSGLRRGEESEHKHVGVSDDGVGGVTPVSPSAVGVHVVHMVSDPSRTLSFPSLAAAQAHIDTWACWMLG